jgi:hypothetical protein
MDSRDSLAIWRYVFERSARSQIHTFETVHSRYDAHASTVRLHSCLGLASTPAILLIALQTAHPLLGCM